MKKVGLVVGLIVGLSIGPTLGQWARAIVKRELMLRIARR